MSKDRAIFEVDAPEVAEDDGSLVTRRGPIFVTGDYPDKQFALTEAEADAAIASFRPVAGDVEHTPTVLDGHLGEMRRIWRDGTTIHGEAVVPRWLHTLLDAEKSKVSMAWDRATKQLTGWGWVRSPRISGAALMSAYFTSQNEEITMLQNQLRTIRDRTVALFAPETGDAGTGTTPAPAVPPPVAPPAPTGPSAAEFNALKAELDRVHTERRAEKAALFAAEYVQKGKILPDQSPIVAALVARALEDDAASPATFAVGTAQVSRVQGIQRLFDSLRSHDLVNRPVPGGSNVIFQDATTPTDDETMVKEADAYARKYADRANGRGRLVEVK